MNLNKEQSNIMPEQASVQAPINLNKTGGEETVNLNKAQPNMEGQAPQHEVFGNIDMQKVHDTETQVTNALENGIENVMGQVGNAFDKVSQGFNNFVDGLDKPKTAAGQIPHQAQGVQTDMYGQTGMNNQANPNMYGQTGMNNQANPNMYGQTGMGADMSGAGQQVNYTNMANMVTPDKLKVEPAVATLLSFLLTGLGQMVNGQVEKGLTLLFGGVAAVFIITLLTCGIGSISAFVLVGISMIDAYKCAQILQSGRPIGKWEFHIFD